MHTVSFVKLLYASLFLSVKNVFSAVKLPNNADRTNKKPLDWSGNWDNGRQRPNIVIFMADDLGRADVSFTEGSFQTPTPNLDKFAWEGIILDRHYVNQICTPTRGAFLTGKYAFQLGLQTGVIQEGEPWGLPLQFKLQPEFLKKLGYSTYMLGKWHLGSHERKYYPDARGFDYWYGPMGGETDWFNYTAAYLTPVPYSGINLRDNGKAVLPNITKNFYLPDLLTSKAEQVIKNANPSKPFYLYFATPVPHTAVEGYTPILHTMPKYQLRHAAHSFSDNYPQRKKYLALIQQMDDSFQRIVDALIARNVLNNTIIVFFSDNGAPVVAHGDYGHGSNYGSNWPLRQGKHVLFEGGIRTPAFIWSPILRKPGRIASQLFHVADWLPTLFEAVGGKIQNLGNISGVSHWRTLQIGSNNGPRSEMVNNIDTLRHQYAMIYQDPSGTLYKIIGGNIPLRNVTGWYRAEGTSASNEMRVWTPVSVDCNSAEEGVELQQCRPWVADCLFDLTHDPCEQNNIASTNAEILQLLQHKLAAYNATSIPQENKPFDPKSHPDLHGGLFVPWKDSKEVQDRRPLTYQPFNPASSL